MKYGEEQMINIITVSVLVIAFFGSSTVIVFVIRAFLK